MVKRIFSGLYLSVLLASGTCVAHARLQSSSPANNAQLKQPPKTLLLKFSEPAQLAVLKLLTGDHQIPITLDQTAKPGDTFTLTLPNLAPGSYTVQWSAIAADDGHVTKGTFKFSIAG